MKNIRTPRTLAECSFETGYKICEPKDHWRGFKAAETKWILVSVIAFVAAAVMVM